MERESKRHKNDFRNNWEVKRGWWVEERSIKPCILPPDGQLAVFPLRDVEDLMDRKYPFKRVSGEKHWYFNNTFDREIAEQCDGRVYANPQVLWEHFLPKEKKRA